MAIQSRQWIMKIQVIIQCNTDARLDGYGAGQEANTMGRTDIDKARRNTRLSKAKFTLIGPHKDILKCFNLAFATIISAFPSTFLQHFFLPQMTRPLECVM